MPAITRSGKATVFTVETAHDKQLFFSYCLLEKMRQAIWKGTSEKPDGRTTTTQDKIKNLAFRPRMKCAHDAFALFTLLHRPLLTNNVD